MGEILPTRVELPWSGRGLNGAANWFSSSRRYLSPVRMPF